MCRATASTTGTTTALPNCLYACVSDTGILKRFPFRAVETHQSRAFARSQSPGIPPALLPDQNFRSILEIPGRQCPGDIVLSNQAKSKSVASGAVFLGVNLQVAPEMVGQGVLAGYLCRQTRA